MLPLLPSGKYTNILFVIGGANTVCWLWLMLPFFIRSEEYDDHLTLSLRRLSCMPSSHRALTVAIPCWSGRQEPSLTGYNVCWMPQPVSSVILGSSTEAWHICFTPSCTGLMFRSRSSISSEWQFTGVSKAGLPSTSWTAATPRWMLSVISDFNLPAATTSSYHDIVAARSAVERSSSPVQWPGTCCLTTSETRHSVMTISGKG